MGNNIGAFRYSNAHSNSTVRWPFKMEHSAFKAVVTRVTLPYFCDSRYICGSRYDVQDSMCNGMAVGIRQSNRRRIDGL